MGLGRRALAILLGFGVLMSGVVPAAQAVPTRRWPVTPGTMGSLEGTVDPAGFNSLRVWSPGAWCYIQPTPNANMDANLDRLVAPHLDAVARAGGSAYITIGHPPPWVFDNHPIAVKPTYKWACGDHGAGVAIPHPSTLRPNRDGSPSVQARRFADYVSRYVDYLSRRYQGRVQMRLEVWNEPNLGSGINPKLPIPGAARSQTQAAKAVHMYESIAWDVVRAKGAQGWLKVSSSALFMRWNTFVKKYLKYHNRKTRISELHFNVYQYGRKSATSIVKEWDRKAGKVIKRLRKYKRLRKLPVTLSEANLNLVNRDGDDTNLQPKFANPDAQRRMATATQMNAYYRGYQAVYWLAPWRQAQTAVFLRTVPGNPARDALVVLHSNLVGKTFLKCKSRKKTRTCKFRGPGRAKTYVIWRNSGSKRVRAPKSGQIVEMTGATQPVRKRQKVRIGTTPIVIR